MDLTGLTTKELWAAASALFLPLVVAVIQQQHWSDRLRALVAFACIFLWTLGGRLYIGDDIPSWSDPRPWVTLFLANALISWGSFRNLWKPTGVTDAIERKTQLPGGAA